MIAGALLLAVPALGLAAMRPAAKANDLTSVARAEAQAAAPGNENSDPGRRFEAHGRSPRGRPEVY